MRALGLVALLAACVEPKAIECGDKICPPDSTCKDDLCIPPGCGDGARNGDEECDGADLDEKDCSDLGYYGIGRDENNKPLLACTPQCELTDTKCDEAFGKCGDLEVNGPESCDGAPPIGLSCSDFGFGVGRLACVSCAPTFAGCSPIGLHSIYNGAHSLAAITANANAIFAAGSMGTVVRFTGDLGWVPLATNTTATFDALWPTDQGVIAGGEDGVIAQFDGTTWTDTTIDIGLVRDLFGRGMDLYAVGGNGEGRIFRRHGDAGWARESIENQPAAMPNLTAVTADNAGNIVAVGRKATILRRDVGGIWHFADSIPATCGATDCDLNDVTSVGPVLVAVGTNSGVVGKKSPILVSSDGGHTWTDLLASVPTETPLISVVANSATEAWVSGNGGELYRFDGATLHRVATASIDIFGGLFLDQRGNLYVAVNDGSVRILENIAWADEAHLVANSVGFHAATTFTSGSDLVTVIGGDDMAYSTTDNVSWTQLTTPVGLTINGLVNLGGTVIAATANGVAYKLVGNAFQQISAGMMGTTSAIHATATKAYLAGGTAMGGKVWTYDGSTFSIANVTSNAALRGIWARADNDIFVVGDGGTIAHWNGTAWSAMSSGTTLNLLGVWGTATDMFAVGLEGTILHYDGTSWRKQHAGTEVLRGVGGTAGNDVFAFGDDALMHYDGTAWSQVALPTPFAIKAVSHRVFAGHTGSMFVGSKATTLTLERVFNSTRAPAETHCIDGWDEDGDGAVDCADKDCAMSQVCRIGGSCILTGGGIACNSTVTGSLFTGIGRVDTLPGTSVITDGPEANYHFGLETGAHVTLSLETARGDAELVVTKSYAFGDLLTPACDLSAAIAIGAGTPKTATFDAAAMTSYTFTVDAPVGIGGDFTLDVRCE